VTQHHRWTCLPPLEVLVESGATLVRTRGYGAHVFPMLGRTNPSPSKREGARRALAAFITSADPPERAEPCCSPNATKLGQKSLGAPTPRVSAQTQRRQQVVKAAWACFAGRMKHN